MFDFINKTILGLSHSLTYVIGKPDSTVTFEQLHTGKEAKIAITEFNEKHNTNIPVRDRYYQLYIAPTVPKNMVNRDLLKHAGEKEIICISRDNGKTKRFVWMDNGEFNEVIVAPKTEVKIAPVSDKSLPVTK